MIDKLKYSIIILCYIRPRAEFHNNILCTYWLNYIKIKPTAASAIQERSMYYSCGIRH